MGDLEDAVKAIGGSGITDGKGWMTADEFAFAFAFQAGVNSRAAVERVMEVVNASLEYTGIEEKPVEDAIRREIIAVQLEVWKAKTGKAWAD